MDLGHPDAAPEAQQESGERPRPLVLVVEDDESVRPMIARALEAAGYQVDTAETGEAALARLSVQLYELALIDLNLPGMGGMEVLSAAPGFQPDTQFVMMTGEGTVEAAVEAMRLGAFDFLRKPLSLPELAVILERALEERSRRLEVARLRRLVGGEGAPPLVGRSPAMKRLSGLIERVAPSRATVLLTGETGTGKEVVAQTIHALSDRARKPFVTVQCSALSESLLESELFGHMKGSFTGAMANRRGLFEEAGEGTLFLDEVATLAPVIQVKLLRVLQERRVQRVGANQPIPVAFRLIAATNQDLANEVAARRFREDLYYRLNVVPIRLPPLREREGDIPLLASFFCARSAEVAGIAPPELSPTLLGRMTAYPWPGNVRELENFIERAIIMYGGRRTIPADAAEWPQDGGTVARAVKEGWTLDRLEREYILGVLESHHGQVALAARAIGIDRRTLARKLVQFRSEGVLPAVPAEPESESHS
jgi:DNA-binding NtrC family response regulator